MDKIKIKICSGTSCFVMGASQIQLLEFDPPEDIKDYIEVEETRCQQHCQNQSSKYNHGPFVEINGELIENADFEKVTNKIREIINKD